MTVLVNKPLGIVSGQAEDGYKPAVVLVRPENRWAEDQTPIQFSAAQLKSLVPAGRLDIDSVGLLVLTQDGRVARQLIGEDSEMEKEYLVRVAYTGHENTAAATAATTGLGRRCGLRRQPHPPRPRVCAQRRRRRVGAVAAVGAPADKRRPSFHCRMEGPRGTRGKLAAR